MSCKRHPESERLLVEEIDCGKGDTPRTICSGLAEFYTPETLVGKNVVVVANLEPRRFRGIMSHGMVLCACSEDKSQVEILECPTEVAPGTRVTLPNHDADPLPVLKKKLAKYWDEVAQDLKTNEKCEAAYQSVRFEFEGKPILAASLANAAIS